MKTHALAIGLVVSAMTAMTLPMAANAQGVQGVTETARPCLKRGETHCKPLTAVQSAALHRAKQQGQRNRIVRVAEDQRYPPCSAMRRDDCMVMTRSEARDWHALHPDERVAPLVNATKP